MMQTSTKIMIGIAIVVVIIVGLEMLISSYFVAQYGGSQ